MDITNNLESSQAIDFLRNLDSRISRLEAKLNIPTSDDNYLQFLESKPAAENFEEINATESNIGELWFANLGIAVLAIGLMIMLTFPYDNLPQFVPTLLGFAVVGGILGVAYVLRNTYSFVSHYLVGTGIILGYCSAIRLYYFSNAPEVSSPFIIAAILLTISALATVYSNLKKSPYLTSISLFLMAAVGIIANDQIFSMILLTIVSGLFYWFHLKNNWDYLLIFGVVSTYFLYLLVSIGNPFVTGNLSFVDGNQLNLAFLLAIFCIYSAGGYNISNQSDESAPALLSAGLNLLGVFSLVELLLFKSFSDVAVIYNFIFAALSYSVAILFWRNEKNRYAISTYSLMAYVALSISIIYASSTEVAFNLLIWQSILVIGTAIWFKAKNIIVANYFMFILIFVAFLAFVNSTGLVNLSFGIAALVSARLLNWRRDRLTIKTEFMRNTYLAIAFISLPYTLQKALPIEYVAYSLVALTIGYYTMSFILKNLKYRWMGHLTLIGTFIHIVIVGLSLKESTYFITNFFALGIVAVLVSITFTRFRIARLHDNEQTNMPIANKNH